MEVSAHRWHLEDVVVENQTCGSGVPSRGLQESHFGVQSTLRRQIAMFDIKTRQGPSHVQGAKTPGVPDLTSVCLKAPAPSLIVSCRNHWALTPRL